MARRAAGGTGPPGDDFSFVSPAVKYVLFFFNMLFWVISMVMVAVGVYARLLKHAGEVVGRTQRLPSGAWGLWCWGGGQQVTSCCGRGSDGVPGSGPRHPAHCGGHPHLPHHLLWLRRLLEGEHLPAAGGEYPGDGVPTPLLDFSDSLVLPPPSPSSCPQFSICLTVVFLLQLAAGVLGFVFSDKARGKVSEIINGAIVHYRDDLDLQNLIDFGQKEFSCCGGVSYKDWSQNMYFNCTVTNPSRERCSVPFSCCLQDTNELVGILLAQILINQIRDQIKLQLYNQQHRADPWY
ncbi:tetraspanin-33 isoform X2 [Melanerpes formicivorus]|uniref:tetraspanin-33 isoform X2 n=1 Tax=Melanerpes formicivorus TaxID=211600 RepID=UPI00358EE554